MNDEQIIEYIKNNNKIQDFVNNPQQYSYLSTAVKVALLEEAGILEEIILDPVKFQSFKFEKEIGFVIFNKGLTNKFIISSGIKNLDKELLLSDSDNLFNILIDEKISKIFRLLTDQLDTFIHNEENDFKLLYLEELINSISNNMLSENFCELVYDRLEKKEPLTEYEKNIFLYLVLHPEETHELHYYDDILNYWDAKNRKYDFEISNKQFDKAETELCEAKDIYFRRVYGLTFENANELVRKYGNDPEFLLKKYTAKNNLSNTENIAKQVLELIIKLRKILEIQDADTIRALYKIDTKKLTTNDDISKIQIFGRTIIDDYLRLTYGKDYMEKLSQNDLEDAKTVTDKFGTYKLRIIKGEFSRFIHVAGAFTEYDPYTKNPVDIWNEQDDKHSMCYSYINESNWSHTFGGVTFGLSRILNYSNIMAMGVRDIYSDSKYSKNGLRTDTGRQEMFYSANELPNQLRQYFSEIIIRKKSNHEILYPTSIVCFDKIDKESVRVANEFGIPIELFYTRDLAEAQDKKIMELTEEFKKDLCTEHILEIINRFNNVRNSLINYEDIDSYMKESICGNDISGIEDWPNALFRNEKLSQIVESCIRTIIEATNENPNIMISEQECLVKLEQIQNYIAVEEKKWGTNRDVYYRFLPEMKKMLSEQIDIYKEKVYEKFVIHDGTMSLSNLIQKQNVRIDRSKGSAKKTPVHTPSQEQNQIGSP